MANFNEIFKRDGFKCRHCRSRSGLHPHHVVYRSHGGGDSNNNIITLCFICHASHHAGFLAIEVIEVLKDDVVVKFIRHKGWKP